MATRKKAPTRNLSAQIAKKEAEEGKILAEMEEIKEGIANAKIALKEKKAALKAVQKERERLTARQEKTEQEKLEKKKQTILKTKIREMVADGVTYEDILKKLD